MLSPFLFFPIAGLLTEKRLAALGDFAGEIVSPENVVTEADQTDDERDREHPGEGVQLEHVEREKAADADDRDQREIEERSGGLRRVVGELLDHARILAKSPGTVVPGLSAATTASAA